MSTALTTDILVIGGGSGGLSVAAGAAQMGADVTLLEGHRMGGDCLNYGCVPSKALIASAKRAHVMRSPNKFGIAPFEPDIDFDGVLEHVQDVIAQIEPHDSVERFQGLGVCVIQEFGRFIDANTVQAGDTVIKARRIVIATGSSAFIPPIPGLDTVPYLTNETLFTKRDKPIHLIVLGGGPIGIEMAQAHRRLGSKVTVIDTLSILSREDPELVEIVKQSLVADGITLKEGVSVTRVEQGITAHLSDGTKVTGSHILVATGRAPNLERLNLDAAGINHDRRGIKVDDSLRSTNRKVYAIGDVAGGFQFTHVAGYHAGVIIKSALFGLPSRARTDHIPRVTFTDPELAHVGMSEAELTAAFPTKTDVIRFEFTQNDRALAERATNGRVKLMLYKGRIKGVSIVGPQAGELINFWAFVIANNIKPSKITAMISPYPTLAEVNKRVVSAYFTPKLFDNMLVKRVVRTVQKWVP